MQWVSSIQKAVNSILMYPCYKIDDNYNILGWDSVNSYTLTQFLSIKKKRENGERSRDFDLTQFREPY